jgi:uncharacterized protein
MQATAATISIPTTDLEKAYQFYLTGIGLALATQPADGERPEPVTFIVAPGLNMMLVPDDGFDWITPSNEVAHPGTSECVIAVNLSSVAEVHKLIEQARAARAIIPEEPGDKPWGYVGYFKDLDGHIWMALKEG